MKTSDVASRSESDPLRVYLDPTQIGPDGYPYAWHKAYEPDLAIKDLIREHAGNRCERCKHPYLKGQHGRGEWSPCDTRCDHYGPWKIGDYYAAQTEQRHVHDGLLIQMERAERSDESVMAQWRILTVHHLNGIKHDCRWWNLAALCQRCHLTIQGRVHMERVYALEHSEWFKPHAAGWYAWSYLGEDLSRDETIARLDELLALELAA